MQKIPVRQPLVSVVMATYNRAALLGKAVESVRVQTFLDWELIIVDDASTDNTADVAGQYAREDARTTFVSNESNKGQVKSLRRGIDLAKGKYIARIDDDDTWRDKQKLEKQAEFLESHPEYVLVGGGIVVVDDQGKELVRFLHPEEDEEIRKKMLFHTPFAHGAVLFRKDAYGAVDGYDAHLGYSEDWDLWLKLGTVGKLYNIQEYMLTYVRGNQRKTASWRDETRYHGMLRKRYKDVYPNYIQAVLFGLLSSLYYRIPFVREILYPVSAVLRKTLLAALTLFTRKKKKPVHDHKT